MFCVFQRTVRKHEIFFLLQQLFCCLYDLLGKQVKYLGLYMKEKKKPQCIGAVRTYFFLTNLKTNQILFDFYFGKDENFQLCVFVNKFQIRFHFKKCISMEHF